MTGEEKEVAVYRALGGGKLTDKELSGTEFSEYLAEETINYKEESAQIVHASKSLVDGLLAMNTANRPEKNGWIKSLFMEISKGQWMLTNQGVGVSKTGVLVDGQNRLKAIAQAGYPAHIKFVLVTGLDPLSQKKIDSGFKRTLADLLAFLVGGNVSVPGQVAAACSAIYISNKSLCDGDDKVAAIADFLEAYGDEVQAIMRALGYKGKSGVCAGLIEYAIYAGKDKAVDLARKIATGEMLWSTHPAFKVRAWLQTHKSGGRIMIKAAREITISACVAHFDNSDLPVLKQTEEWPSRVKGPK